MLKFGVLTDQNRTGAFAAAEATMSFKSFTQLLFLSLLASQGFASFPDTKLFSARCTSNQKFCVSFSPNDMPIHFVGDALKSAKKSIRILTYNMDVVELAPLLIQKPASVTIELGADYVRSDKDNASNRVIKILPNKSNILKYRTPVLRGRTPQNHNKIIIIDDEILLMGSANHSYSGLVGNFENTMLVRDPETIAKYNAELDEIRDLSLAACRLFATNRKPGTPLGTNSTNEVCLSGGATFDRGFDLIAKTGEVPVEFLTESAAAAVLPILQKLNSGSGNTPLSLKKLLVNRYETLQQKSETRASEVTLAYDESFYLRFSGFYDLIQPPWARKTRISAAIRSEQRGVNRSYGIENVTAVELRNLIGRACRKKPLPADPELTPEQLCVCMTQFGLLDSYQRSTGSDFGICLQDQRFGEFQKQLIEIEKTIDGKSIAELIAAGIDPFQYKVKQTGPIQAYFAPEDNIEPVITREMHATYSNPDRSLKSSAQIKAAFAYVGTNFITNRNFSEALNAMKEAGVRVSVFFDKGRMNDPNFQSALDLLKPLGIIRQTEAVNPASLTVFENRFSTDYGAFHHKYAIIGTDKGIKLVNGSANWSSAAVRSNDENLLVIEDEQIATLFLAQMIQDLYISRYRQNWNSPGFQEELKEMSARVPCLMAVLGLESKCTTRSGESWVPAKTGAVKNHVLVSVQLNSKPDQTSVWAWVARTSKIPGVSGSFPVQLFTDESMGGHWMGAIPAFPGDKVEVKLIRGARNYEARANNLPGPGVPAEWEYEGVGNGRFFEFVHGAYGCVPTRPAVNGDHGVTGVEIDSINWKLVWGSQGSFTQASPGCRDRNPTPLKN
ncbi:MAG: hypothetical protein K2X47_17085 [Bdellovibrionales bacterium]|nr:hypothetical protein [Bdellovibrionales bacterium]